MSQPPRPGEGRKLRGLLHDSATWQGLADGEGKNIEHPAIEKEALGCLRLGIRLQGSLSKLPCSGFLLNN